MKKTSAEILDYYDQEIVKMISEKYGFEQIAALRKFLTSEVYRMLSDSELEMWESEQITGEPRNSLYLRSDEHV